jgi:hypothetical protein
MLRKEFEDKAYPSIGPASIKRYDSDKRHWTALLKKNPEIDNDEALIIFLKKDLKLPWASFGNRESNVNFVLSYGRNHEL